ncbi:SET domain-containing protein [Parathielavia hyrcaniae]|uniref:SET domain-containing protein n=1 Tax=Parathielavia hyrcaniae TaxID=113614 RepID=A0AAN6Q095_9PEZI|nr:SET domain-containing protein [Parathielavia hyrcaniae]
MKESDKARFDELLKWAQLRGAELHPSLEIYHDERTKFSIRVKDSCNHGLQSGFRAVSCPVSTTLSFLNALADGPIEISSSYSHTGAFPHTFMQKVPPYVVGRFFLIHEYLKRKDSFWWPYIATLPQPEQINAWALPAFWPEDDIAHLEGTNAHFAIEEVQANVKQEFKQARKILKGAEFPNWQDYAQLLYKWAFCIYTSRSFRPSLVLSDAAKQHVSALLPAGCHLDDFSILQPVFDIPNHSMTAAYSWDTASDPTSCQLICRDAYQPGNQVYNNYGLKTNSELLLGYGFILPEDLPFIHNDYVHVRKRNQGEAAAPESDAQNANPKPKDFLISLEPISRHASLVGSSRVVRQGPKGRLASLPCFAHFEPALVEDLAMTMATREQRAALDRWNAQSGAEPSGNASVQQQPPQELMALVEGIKATLGAKLWADYQRLKEVDGGGSDGGDLPLPGNGNQKLAGEYRWRCERVYEAALESLMEEDMAGRG